MLVEAHRAAAKQPYASDDATLVERLGHQVKVYMGSYHNLKVTTPDDLLLAQILIRWHRG
jgi:2-C-methyl-D-erythritol 4-phosphate cytidylyltransferase